MSNYCFTIPTGGYDSEDRLVSFNRTSGLNQSWNLSAVGDWNSVTTNGTAQTRTRGPTHELLTGGGSSVTTDTKGNITAIPASLRPNAATLTSVWDFDNRLSSATTGTTTVSHKYDALGRRVARTVATTTPPSTTTTVYVQSNQQTIADYTAGAAPASSTYRYIYASYIDEPVMRFQTSGSIRIYYHRNQQYSITALTNSSGAVLERYAYTAYGVPAIANAAGTVLTSSAHNNRYTYTGREWDNDLKQYHYRARMYDASLGRFCSRDPISNAPFFEYYDFVHSCPLRYVDPLGNVGQDNVKEINNGDGCGQNQKACIESVRNEIRKILQTKKGGGINCFGQVLRGRVPDDEMECRSKLHDNLDELLGKLKISCSTDAHCGSNTGYSRGPCLEEKKNGRKAEKPCPDYTCNCDVCPPKILDNNPIVICTGKRALRDESTLTNNPNWCNISANREALARVIVHEALHLLVGPHVSPDKSETDNCGRPDAKDGENDFFRTCVKRQ